MYRMFGVVSDYYVGYAVPVADFTMENLAHGYIENSRLKSPRHYRFPFRKSSLLSRFSSAYVDYVSDDVIPVDPEI